MVGTLSALYNQLFVYTAQFESLAARWSEERFDLLQPDSPGVHHIVHFVSSEQIKDVAAKEMQLLGASSGSRTAAGGMNFAKGEAAPAGDDGREAET